MIIQYDKEFQSIIKVVKTLDDYDLTKLYLQYKIRMISLEVELNTKFNQHSYEDWLMLTYTDHGDDWEKKGWGKRFSIHSPFYTFYKTLEL